MTIAVKNVKRVLSLLIAITVLLSFTAYADVAITNPATHTVGVSENITVTVTGATSGEEVALLIYDTTVTSENILYVDQKTATGSSVAFEFGIRSGFDVQKTYIVKAGSTNSSAAATGSLVFEEITVNGIKITSNPTKTVYANGEAFSTAGLAVQEAEDGVPNGTAIEAADYTVSEVDTSTAGAKLVVVTSGDYSDTFAIFVQPAAYVSTPVTGITAASTSVEVGLGGTADLSYTVAPVGATDKTVSWVSLDPTVATVANGTVTGVALGKTKIIGVTVDGGFSVAYDVAVRHADIVTNGIAGRIVDGDTLAGIAGATITIETDTADDYEVTTDADGYFKIEVGEDDDVIIYADIVADGYIEREIEDLEFESGVALGNDGYLTIYRTLLGDIDQDENFNFSKDFAAFKKLYSNPPSLDYSDVE